MNGHLQLRPFCFPGTDTALYWWTMMEYHLWNSRHQACPFKKVSGN